MMAPQELRGQDVADQEAGGSRNPSPDLETQSPDLTCDAHGCGELDEATFLGSMFNSRRIASLKTLTDVSGSGDKEHEHDIAPSNLMSSCSFASFISAASNIEGDQDKVITSRVESSGSMAMGEQSPPAESKGVLPSSQNPTAMLANLGWFWRTLSAAFFGGAVMERRQVEEIRAAASCGSIIYVVEAHSWFHQLFWNFIVIRNHLPLAALAVGMLVVPYVSVMWPAWLLLRLLQRSCMSEEQRREERKSQAVQAARNGQTFIFSVGESRAGKGEPGDEACELLEEIIVLQRNSSMPLIVCPLIAIWNRSPLPPSDQLGSSCSAGREERDERVGFLLAMERRLFGSRRQPSSLRAFVSLLLDLRNHMQVGGGLPINLSEWLLDYRAASSPNSRLSDRDLAVLMLKQIQLRFDNHWLQVTGPPCQSRSEVRKAILSSLRVKAAITAAANQQAQSVAVIERKAKGIIDRMVADRRLMMVRTLCCCLQRFFNFMFHAVYLDESGLCAVQQNSLERNCPVIYVPTFRGILDYFLLSYVLFTRDMATPVIACSDSSHMISKFFLRRIGGFFMRKSLASEDKLYKEIFREYISFLLETRCNLEVFIEGSRPYSGKSGQPRMGLVGIAVEAVMSGRLRDAVIAPVSIQYDRVVEGNNYKKLMAGDQRNSHVLPSLLSSHWNIHMGFGNIIVNFAEPLSVRTALEEGMLQVQGLEGQAAEEEARRTSFNVVRTVASLAHKVTWMVNQRTVIVPTSLVATVLLTHSCRGISLSDLVENVQWLKVEIMARGGLVAPMEEVARAVGNSVKRISNLVKIPKPDKTLEPLLKPRDSHRLELSSYRNQCLHVFVEEALLVCCLISSPSEAGKNAHWMRTATLLRDAETLAEILKLEFTYSPRESKNRFQDAITRLASRGTVLPLYDDGYGERVQILTTRQARRMIGLLRGMLLPFLDAYWVAALSLLPLQTEAKGGVLLASHLKRMQKIAQTMYLENKVHSSEAASSVSLINAVTMLEANRLIARSAIEQGVLIRVTDVRDRPAGDGLFRSLVDAIKQIDARRRIAGTLRIGPLQHEPSIT